MSTYQDVVSALGAAAAWAFTESSGTDFVPYIGGTHLTGSGTFSYRQTGPFAASFGLQEHVGAKLSLPFLAAIVAPVSYAVWLQLTSPPSSSQYILYTGAASTNGGGYYINAGDGHIHIFVAVGHDFDTGVVWPNDGNFHLFVAVQENPINLQDLYIDGVLVWRGLTQPPIAAAPNTTFLGGENGTSAAVSITMAMPAFFPLTLTPTGVANLFLAATDPNGAIGAGAGLPNDILNRILNAVYRTFPSA